MKRFFKGMLVSANFRGGRVAFGIVRSATPIKFTVEWESGTVNRLDQKRSELSPVYGPFRKYEDPRLEFVSGAIAEAR